jgi:hypothetical protein
MNKTKLVSIIGLFALLVLTSLSSCDKLIEEIGTQEIEVKDLEIDIDALISENSLRADGDVNSFSGSDTLLLDDETFKEYVTVARLIKAFKLTSVTLEITSKSGEGTFAQDININSEALESAWSLADYSFGTTYKGDSALTALVSKFVDAIIAKKSVDVFFSGKTDAPENTKLALKLKIGGILTVQLLSNDN